MTKLVVWLLFFGLFAIQTVGHMNSDPAPGRSPGPPAPSEPLVDSATVAVSDPGPGPGPAAPPTPSPPAVARRPHRDEPTAHVGLLTTPTSERSQANTSMTRTDVESGQTSAAGSNGRDIEGTSSEEDAEVEIAEDVERGATFDGADRKSENMEVNPTGSGAPSSSCPDERPGFLNGVAIVQLGDGPSTNHSQQRPLFDIRLELHHDIFDIDTRGISCGLVYKVSLLTNMPPSAFPTPAPSSSSSSSPSSSSPSSATSASSGSQRFSNSHYSGEFYVETRSATNGRERGSFGGHAPSGNKLHRNDADQPSFYWNDPTDFVADGDGPEVAARHKRLPGQETSTSGRGAGGNGDGKESQCPENKWMGKAKSSSWSTNGARTKSLNLWLVNELCEQDDTIEFRVFFRTTSKDLRGNRGPAGREEAGDDAQDVVFAKSFTFRQSKDCQLQLRKSAAGTLDYTALPLYSIDCTVHFPSYSPGTASSTSTSTTPSNPPSSHTPGMLVELQRLNVPCSGGGSLQFEGRPSLCGKLEELSAADRSYHFDVSRNTSLRVVQNPMFSLSFKLVDFCYNVSTSNQTGEFYVQPTMPDALECFFRIHLPHGNRILLRLVANNATEILSGGRKTSGDGDGDEDAFAIYTSLGRSIDTQVVNLTLSGSAHEIRSWADAAQAASVNRTDPRTRAAYSSDDVDGLGRPFGHVNDALTVEGASGTASCEGVVIKVFENDFAKWSQCVLSGRAPRGFVLESSSNTLSVYLFRPTRTSQPSFESAQGTRVGWGDAARKPHAPAAALPSIYLAYQARPVAHIVSNCAFGWIAMQQFCVTALVETFHTWFEAEQRCVELGGHLASIRNDLHQQVINELLVRSPGYQDHFAYWVGGSDKNFEGDFRWSDGLPFQYTNWFPGWSQHGHYNKQPNDDGLSSQDCIELRRYFRAPPGVQVSGSPLTSRFMWNDRDCGAKNFVICERAMSDEALRRSWINDCNKTVSLTKEHPRASVWSPSFPRQYPDNANCFTTITAPAGYRIVIEFEELVIENEPGCSYDYLEVTEPSPADTTKSLKSSSQPRNLNSHSDNDSNNNKNKNKNNNNNNNNNNDITTNQTNKNLRKRSSYEKPSLSSYTATSTNNYNANFNGNNNKIYSNSYNNFNIAQTNYRNLLNVFTNLYKPHANFLIQTPDYPKGNPYYHTNRIRSEELLPKRLCGDWSSKLKLLRHVSTGSYLGLHFVSDYSHHFGGYKAKAYMENTASECANERLKPYNGSCYLFVSYPEVDWLTAQQVCHGMGAKLSSVSSSDEHRFITSNIRNQIDYSPQLIYWLGAELERNGQFEWTDDSKMSFQGWLPGQGQFDVVPSDAVCLGLQWKMSPTPMLPSGLYWQSQKCSKVGGYVCKKPKESYGKFAFDNFTVTGTEGRLVSPAYPNAYPLNIDYWIHILAPERTRIVVQFQKIDLEPQDECLYDFVSIQNYELVSKITLEPGTNPVPMAMLASDEVSEYDEIGADAIDSRWGDKLQNRIERSIPRGQSRRRSAERRRKRNSTHQGRAQAQAQAGVDNQIVDLWARGRQPQNSHRSPKDKGRDKFTHSTMRRIGPDQTKTSRHNNHRVQANENPKRRRRKNPGRVNGRSSEKHSNQQQQGGHHSRIRRSTLVADGGFGDDAVSAPSADNAQSFLPYVRWCGSHDSNMSKFDFVASSNQVVLNFHSDYSAAGLGFAAHWKAIDISGCPVQTLTSREGSIASPNYPYFLLNNLNCAYVVQAPAGRRVWLEFVEFDMLADVALEVDVGSGVFRPFRTRQHVNDGIFVSENEQLRVQFRTGHQPRGRGFQAVYHTVGPLERRERVINLTNNATGYLFQLNYPHDMPDNVDFTQHLVAPFGDNILLELHGVEFSKNGCPDNNVLEIYDNYADNNGTNWQLCKFQQSDLRPGQLEDGDVNDDGVDYGFTSTEQDPQMYSQMLPYRSIHHDYPRGPFVAPPVYITSYLNTLHVRQRTTSKSDANLNATVRVQIDNNYKLKLATEDKSVESCVPNPCQYNGKCVTTNNGSNYCKCQGHYTGRFCGLHLCELEPCVFGKCELTPTNFKCQCQPGYTGQTCEQKQRPCADNPCEGRGICYEKSGGFFCRCHAWWEGHRCERRMLHIPYKPLSERMLQEPFWLGLITVFVVLAVIGLVWCAKRHFPEKIEKLLAEEADRNRPPGSVHGHHHHTSLREQLQFTTAIPQTTANNAPGTQRSIFNRLGIRKPSLLSLSSPNPTAGGGGAAARTFSLDDLLRPPPRRSPSPRKKRNNSTPVKKNAAEKKQILQQLVSPAATAPKPKVTLGELISMSENRLRANAAESEGDLKETTFSENSASLVAAATAAASVARTIADPKLEKKVTFARLLNKVSAEMSSGSEVDIGHMGGTRNSSALSLPTDIQFRASSMPPSPCTNDIRSPHSTSSNQGSDSLSSSDLALADFGLRSTQSNSLDVATGHPGSGSGHTGGGHTRLSMGSTSRPKVSSADSILAMFRNFASTLPAASNTTSGTITSNASIFVSPSTTPTASSPQDDVPGDDESSTSSMHTPVSFSSGPPDSPVFYRQTTIEVPVLDVLNAHKSSSPSSSASASSSSSNFLHPPTILLEIPSAGINNKCLSPIREMPTPIPSPALTPLMPRQQRSNSPIFQEDPLGGGDFSDDDERSDRSDAQLSDAIGLKLEKYRSVDTDVETTPTGTTTTSMASIGLQSVGGKAPMLRLQPAPAGTSSSALTPPCITIDVEPPTPEEKTPRPRDLIIPTLTVEQPSPTKNRHPMIIFPGSPPPQRASIGETSFMFPNKQQQKRLLKQFEKPTSLDLPFAPPTITVTSNLSELESDTEPLSPAPKLGGGAGGLMPPNPVGMCYLSPFTMCSRTDRTISESNLSSSGYSSMASPGPSRCGSSNPLCPNEMDEPGGGHTGHGLSLHVNLMNRRKSSALASCKENITNGKGAGGSGSSAGSNADQIDRHRQRSDSETFSDDILLESNDEGIGTDHIDEKLDDCRLSGNRFKELNVFMEEQVLIEVEEPPAPTIALTMGAQAQMAQLQLPSIVIQIEGNEKGLSPVSSRSESPLSERAGIGRFSPHFYGRKDQLPFTDSDGLYDFPSSDGKGVSSNPYSHQRRSSSKKRERKSSKCSATQSPTKHQLDVPAKESPNTPSPSGPAHVCNKHCHSHHHPCPATSVTTRKSPKRRPVSRHPVATSSSSSESLVSAKELAVRPLPRRLNSPNREKRPRKQESLSEDEVADALLRRISPSIVKEDDLAKPKCKINRLRAIGNQIRFLRRLEKSIKTRERLASPSDSCPEENTDDMDSPQASSPLLQSPTPTPGKTRLALCRQKRLPGGTYGITAAAMNSSNWKGTDRSLIGDDPNSE